ncbi:MAG: carboxypeptidase-like regulatory domain-containing protein [Tannerellaceae bacterium]|nr:carboxypeptidase-like regulatory domain-containing protein [Tannerellaceae bacterium]
MRKKLCILYWFVCCICSLYAQNEKNGLYSIKGQVIDSLTNETVPYATLSIAFENSPQESVKLLACDIDGKFETSLNSPGKYIISCNPLERTLLKKRFQLQTIENRSIWEPYI